VDKYKPRVLELLAEPHVLQRLPEPVKLASGQMSDIFIDGKLAVDDADDLELVGEAMFAAARRTGAHFEAVGGMELGAVPFTFAVQRTARCKWFLVRKTPKGRGTNRWVEGARLCPGMPIMLVEDVVTTGGSISRAYARVREEGAEVVFATALVDRGEEAGHFFATQGVPYLPLLTYRDLGIAPVAGN
jgi:orotate phosphoribosyltransferase